MEIVNRSTVVGMDGTVQVNIAGSTVASGGGAGVSHIVGQHKPSMKGLVFDETIQLIPNATVTVYRCPDAMCRYEQKFKNFLNKILNKYYYNLYNTDVK